MINIKEVRKQLNKLKLVNKPKLVPPIKRDKKTGWVTDATGRIIMICGPRFWRELRKHSLNAKRNKKASPPNSHTPPSQNT